MAATIYRGTLNGTGSQYWTTLYENTTGKNVRLVWAYARTFTPNPSAGAEFYVGTTSNPDHNNGNDLETWYFNLEAGTIAGKWLSTMHGSDKNSDRMYSGSSAYFPTEFYVPNTEKVFVQISGNFSLNNYAFMYNFIAITED